jgi:rRNA maturation protein Nop10
MPETYTMPLPGERCPECGGALEGTCDDCVTCTGCGGSWLSECVPPPRFSPACDCAGRSIETNAHEGSCALDQEQ